MAEIVDYWANAFLPDRADRWRDALAAQGVPVKIRRDPEDGFAEAEAMVARMDSLGIVTLILPTCELPEHAGVTDFEPIAMRWEEMEELARRHPGRFAAQWSVDPRSGMDGVQLARERIETPWVVALHLHTHSFDLPFDAAELYPYYALASDAELPFVMQAGASGGLRPSHCGRPIGVDRPALYFPQLRFVLSHTGWPWVDEAVAMGLKFPHVHLGTASLPPRRWHAALVDFLRGPGKTKVLFGTSFPTVGHRHALGQLDELGLELAVRAALVGGNARRVFARLAALD